MVVESESRIWIGRISRDLSDAADAGAFVNSLSVLEIYATGFLSASINDNSALTTLSESIDVPDSVASIKALPFPSWWSGECNDGNHPGSFRLDTSYDFEGLVACGPTDRQKGGYSYSPVYFFLVQWMLMSGNASNYQKDIRT